MPSKKTSRTSQVRKKSNVDETRLRGWVLAGAFICIFAIIGVMKLHPSRAAATYYHTCSGFGHCVNRKQGGKANGTWLITYNRENMNENFTYQILYEKCGGGVVTGSCPFKTSTMNQRYLGNSIIEIVDVDDSTKCLAADSQGLYSLAALEPCGSTGYIFVWNTKSATKNYIENVSWSNTDGAPRWMCEEGYAQQILIRSKNGNAGTCQWYFN